MGDSFSQLYPLLITIMNYKTSFFSPAIITPHKIRLRLLKAKQEIQITKEYR